MNMTNHLTRATVGLMLDIETLAIGSDAVVTQTALFGWDLDDPDTLLELPHFQYWPIQPQQELIPPRRIHADTLIFHTTVGTDFSRNDSKDFDDLPSLARHFLRAFDRFTEGGKLPYELWARGMFDTVIMKSLLNQCGFDAPWDFRSERDLRTLEAISGVSYKDVPQPVGFIKHRADWDCNFQIRHHTACMKALGAAKAD
jgi:hypothetical protein